MWTGQATIFEGVMTRPIEEEAGDEAVAKLLLGQVAEAHRVAARILGDPAEAQDAVQEAVVAAWRRRSSLRRPESVEAWFGRIVVNECRDELRRRARAGRARPVEAIEQPTTDRFGDRDELARALARLTPDEQIVLALRYGRDLTVPAIAARTGVPEGTVKSRLHHALGHLRSALAAEARAEEPWR
jgi:RNA polymerase sigma factor (sigma-70 family)